MRDVHRGGFGDDILQKAVEEFSAVLDRQFRVCSKLSASGPVSSRAPEAKYLAEGIEYGIEIHKNFALGDFGDVVQALGGEVSYPVLGVCEAGEDRFDELVHVWSNVDAKCDSSSGETNQTTVSNV